MHLRHPRKTCLRHDEITQQHIVFQIHIHAELGQRARARRICVFDDDQHINIRLGVEIAAHFRAVQNHALHLVAKLLAQAREIFRERASLAPSQIFQTAAFHLLSNALRAITRR